MAEEVSRLGRVRRDLITRTGIEPTQEEVAPRLTSRSTACGSSTTPSRALISPTGLSATTRRRPLATSSKTPTPAPEASAIAMEGQALLRRVLAELPGREAEVLMLRYGISDGQVRTLTEVGHELGLSRRTGTADRTQGARRSA